MKKHRIVFILLLLLLTLAGCNKQKEQEKGTYTEIGLRDTIEMFNNSETFAILLHQTNCAWCREVDPAFEEYVIEHGYNAYHLNFTNAYQTEADTYKADVDILVNHILESILQYDEEYDEMTLFIPEVVFVKNGYIMYDHCGTVESHDPYEAKMTEAQLQELYSYFDEGFSAIY